MTCSVRLAFNFCAVELLSYGLCLRSVLTEHLFCLSVAHQKITIVQTKLKAEIRNFSSYARKNLVKILLFYGSCASINFDRQIRARVELPWIPIDENQLVRIPSMENRFPSTSMPFSWIPIDGKSIPIDLHAILMDSHRWKIHGKSMEIHGISNRETSNQSCVGHLTGFLKQTVGNSARKCFWIKTSSEEVRNPYLIECNLASN